MTQPNISQRACRTASPTEQPAPPSSQIAPTGKPPSKLDRIEALLRAKSGASITDMMAATQWQQHSVRGALAGALRKRGLVITSDKVAGVRRYRAQDPE